MLELGLRLLPETYYMLSVLSLLLYALNGNGKKNIYGYIIIRIQIIIITRLLINNSRIISYNNSYINDELSMRLRVIMLISRRGFIYKIKSLIIMDLRYTYEYLILILTSILGMILLIKANDLIRMYLAIELQSMGMYILAAYSRTRYRTEGGLKYYVMGGLASCIQLLGIAIIYGLLGTTNYMEIGYILSCQRPENRIYLNRGMVLIISRLVFKLGGVPFHMWLPDVYQGAPLISTAFFSILPKLSIFIAIYRLNFFDINNLFFLLSIFSIILGTIQALSQSNIKRLLAYSAISHIGFIFIGIRINLWNASIYYLIIYMIMSIRIFAIIRELKINNFSYFELNSLRLLRSNQPLLRFSLTIILFSMAGIPPLAGFFSKFYLLESAIYQNFIFLRFIAILGSMIATVYYIQIIQLLYFYNPLLKAVTHIQFHLINKISYSNSIIIRFINLLLILFIFMQQELFIFIRQFI